MLVNTVSCGGNLLMNVGPTARGTFDQRASNALRVYADWLALHGRAIYGCTASDLTPPQDCRFTQTGERLYLHVFAWPFGYLHLDGLAGRVSYAQLLNDGSEIPLIEPGTWPNDAGAGTVVLQLPVREPDVVVPVIELVLR
jgi:alpha-L-fucosidase